MRKQRECPHLGVRGIPIEPNQIANTEREGVCFMSQLVSLPPVSPGIVYAVRKLLEYAPASESDARRLCARLWPKMDSDAVQTVVVYWHVQAEPQQTPSSLIVGEGRGRP
jgi:hypothetical protein